MKFVIGGKGWLFDSARDAIDAVSAFEATVLFDVQYSISLTSGDRWQVVLRDRSFNILGYLGKEAE
jgi:hypothetical protein